MLPSRSAAWLLVVVALLIAAPAFAQHGMVMSGALGPYPMTREASGTSWQPDSAPMAGLQEMRGDWMLMTHGYLDVAYDHQGGPRGDEKLFAPGMFMYMGSGDAGPGTLGFKAMLSPDPLMGASGYPLLFQTGETADGVTALVDRQHPHDFFMELAGSYSVALGDAGSLFVYGGLPGEPALGPSAFMHRASGVAIPEAPLTHHWLDSTHVTFGVATLGATYRGVKVEASAFNGREPDQRRWNIETRGFDAWSGRLTYNPGPDWSGQVSFGYLPSPEQLEPLQSLHRTTASLSHSNGSWSTTFAVGVNRENEHALPGYLLESTRQSGHITVFGRAEYLRTTHLFDTGPLAGQEFGVGKLSLGGSYEVAKAGPLAFNVGALVSAYRYSDTLEPAYGSGPVSGMVFLRTAFNGVGVD